MINDNEIMIILQLLLIKLDKAKTLMILTRIKVEFFIIVDVSNFRVIEYLSYLKSEQKL